MIVCRINCGATNNYTDSNGNLWLADQALTEGNTWGAVGGNMISRAIKTIPGTPSPEVYRSERYGVDHYEFKVPEGLYTVRLHFAENFYSNCEPGQRLFDITANGTTSKGFDPVKDAGGFARPTVQRFSGIAPENGMITIRVGKGFINGIEIFRQETTTPAVKRILFIGNSYTGFWDLPGTIARMVNTGERGLTIETDRSIMPGKGLKDHWARGEAAQMIRTGKYDYVVLQEYRFWSAEEHHQILQIARNFNEVIRASGAKPLLYCTWARKVPVAESAAEQKRVTDGYGRVARELDAAVIPVGPAWQVAKEQGQELNLMMYEDAAFHPTLYSAYLSACVFYGELTGQSPEGHPLTMIGQQRQPIESEIARFLQRVAWETVRTGKMEVTPLLKP